jgi:hypothetical protein
MRQGIAFAAFAGALMMGAGAFAACPPPPAPSTHPKEHAKPRKPDPGCVDLNGLPQISEHIVAGEAAAAAPVKSALPEPVGPINPPPGTNSLTVGGLAVGLTKPDPGVRPTPTVGYKWSLDQ